MKRQRPVNRAGKRVLGMRDLLCLCGEHLGRDADFPALRGLQGRCNEGLRHARTGRGQRPPCRALQDPSSADEMPVRERRQVDVGLRAGARVWLLHAYAGNLGLAGRYAL
jgi:hypothetical protein